MTQTLTVACIQNRATPDVHENMERCIGLARAAAGDGARLICTAEYFSGLRTEGGAVHPVAFEEADHPVIPAFAAQARELGAWFLLGSLGVRTADGRINNRSYLIDPTGATVARYDKIHMFDVDLGEGQQYRESATISPGADAVVADTPWGGLGLTICYDLRFPALYRALAHAGASLFAVPAAFTKVTGEAHWHVLNRARAIESGAFVIAPCQTGALHGGGECFGHSLIVDPWGEVLADGGEDEGYCMAEIDPAAVASARRRIPSLEHDRDFTTGQAASAAE